jgi:glyoxylase-like metal-dependent hydrolase (beta-lactamase superfamily II)
MRRILLWIAVAIALIVATAGACAVYQLRSLTVTRITDDLHMIEGWLGGNVAVLRTGAGAVIVDTMTFSLQGAKIRALTEELTGEPVVMLINTHYHADHTHGNPAFLAGTQVIATAQTLLHLQERDASYWNGDAAALLPNHTIDKDLTIRLGTKTLQLLRPGRGHTDGDLVVAFVEDQTLHAGDLFFNRRYPSIDLAAGGTARGWADTLDAVLELPFVHVIPGHGALSDRDGLKQFQRFMRQIAAVGADARARNWTVDETLHNARITEDAGYTSIELPFVLKLDRESVLRAAWSEATAPDPRSPAAAAP